MGRSRNGRPEMVWETVKTESVMNVVLDSLKTRRSIRGYDPDRMPAEELIGQIIEAGTYAPTGRGMQSPRIVAVTDRTVRDRLSALNAAVMGSASDPFYGAPVVLVVLADRSRPTYLYDGSLVMGNLMNAAAALGIGSCWINRAMETFELPEGKALLAEWGLGENWKGVGNCILGYTDQAVLGDKARKEDRVLYV